MANQDNKPSFGKGGPGKKFSDKKGPFKKGGESKRFSGGGSKFKGEDKKVFNRSDRFDRPAGEGRRFEGRSERFAGDAAKGPFKAGGPKYSKSRFGSSNERTGTGAGYQGRDRKEGKEDRPSRSGESYRPASGEKWRERREPDLGSRPDRGRDRDSSKGRFSDREAGDERNAGRGRSGEPSREGGKFSDRRGGGEFKDRGSASGRSPYSDRPRESYRPREKDRPREGEADRGRYGSRDNDGGARFGQRDRSSDRERAGGRFGGGDQDRGRAGERGTGRTFGPKRFEGREDRPREDRGQRREGSASRETRAGGRPDSRRGSRPVTEAPNYDLKRYDDREERKKSKAKGFDDVKDGKVRLNRYIANAGICSRREADELIAAGEIKVNGEVVTEMGYMVGPSDTVQYGKKKLNREKTVYVLLNKPKDFITTTEDPEGRKTVMDLVGNASKERIFPVGRLDRNTTGLLLFTNDGELAQKLSHPSHKNAKIYQVELSEPLTEADFNKILEGVELEDGKAEVDELAIISPDKRTVGIEVHIGKNRIVRRIFEHLGYEVVGLDRVQYAGLTKKDLPRGKWRFLTEKEVIRLKYFM